jgi:hypothetical protein
MPRILQVLVGLLMPVIAHAAVPFTEEAVARGLDYTADAFPLFGHGVAFVDLDGDGDSDVVAIGRVDGRVGVFENDGAGDFTDRSATSGIPLKPQASGVCAADYDADDDLDLYISSWLTGNVLLRNDGAFAFIDVTVAGGVGDEGAGSGCSWADYNGDGWLDLFVSNRTGTDGSTIPNRLYRNLGNGSFVEVMEDVGITGDGWSFHGVFLDYDEDGDADLYVSNDKCGGTGLTNRLWRNDAGTFFDATSNSETGACIDSMGVAVGDFDGNLHLDMYPTNTADGNPLYLNDGDATFTEFSVQAGVRSNATGWGTAFLDYDNDGYQELYVCNADAANRLYNHDGSWPCEDHAAALDVDDSAASYGLGVADVDGDGDLDLLVSDRGPLNDAGPLRLFINHEGETREWVRFRVVGSAPNLLAIGARVDIRTGTTWQTWEVAAGGTYKSQSELELHFGLNTTTLVDEIVVQWPGGSSRTLSNLVSQETWTLYPPELLGDADQDGDTEPDDFPAFVDCVTGAAVGMLQPGCEMMDLDGDGDVDDSDFDGFMMRYVGPLHDCNGNGLVDLEDIFAETSSDADANAVPDECESSGAPAGMVPPAAPLSMQHQPDGDLQLSWSPSCIGGDGDYMVYEGDLGDWTSHRDRLCSTAGATSAILTPSTTDAYYLVVPSNGAREGSYGRSSAGIERPPSSSACLEQAVAACP